MTGCGAAFWLRTVDATRPVLVTCTRPTGHQGVHQALRERWDVQWPDEASAPR